MLLSLSILARTQTIAKIILFTQYFIERKDKSMYMYSMTYKVLTYKSF